MKVQRKRKLKEISDLFFRISEIWETLTPAEQEFLNSFHGEAFCLGYCIRWGQQAADECIDELS